ncbi:MAG: hypothetical protein GEU90_11655 [Gemmatimonas sp.]|nr:hypothetical protein [Gemmatimonas sp.]
MDVVPVRPGSGDDDTRAQQCPVGATIPLLEDAMDPRLRDGVGQGSPKVLGNADIDAVEATAVNGHGPPAGTIEKRSGHTLDPLPGSARQVGHFENALELVEKPEEVALIECQHRVPRPARSDDELLDFVQSGGHGLQNLAAVGRSQTQAAQGALDLLELLRRIDLGWGRIPLGVGGGTR